MRRNNDSISKSIDFLRKPTAEVSTAELETIYETAKRVNKEEEAVLESCKNCMETIRMKKNVVDKLREETEADMIASAGRLDEHIRKVTRLLNTVTRMHMTDSTEAVERLSKLFDIDLDADAKMEDLRKSIAYLEYQQKLNESIFYRIYLYTYSLVQWLVDNVVIFIRRCQDLFYATIRSTKRYSSDLQSETRNEEVDVSFVPNRP